MKFWTVSALILFAVISQAAVDIRWEVETAKPQELNQTFEQGATFRLGPKFKDYGIPRAFTTSDWAQLYYQTNGMGDAWFTNTITTISMTDTGRIWATWSPDLDIGASKYRFFVGVATDSGIIYRAYGSITMKKSPGFLPATRTPALATWATYAFASGAVAQAAAAVDLATAAAAHATEASNTVHGGFIAAAWAKATNAWQMASTAFGWGNHADAGYATVDLTNGLAPLTALNSYLPLSGGTMMAGPKLFSFTDNWFRIYDGYNNLFFGEGDLYGMDLSGPLGQIFLLPGINGTRLHNELMSFTRISPPENKTYICTIQAAARFESSTSANIVELAREDVAIAATGDVLVENGTVTADAFVGSGSGLTNGPWIGTNQTPWRDEGYSSTNPAYVWNGAQEVTTNAWTNTTSGLAVYRSSRFELVPYTNRRHDVTGAVTIVSSRYIVNVAGDWDIRTGGAIPTQPIKTESQRVSPTSWVVRAWCSTDPQDAAETYYGYVSNVTVYTYDRIMDPLSYTNDAAGMVTRFDSLPGEGLNDTTSDPRRGVNAESMRRYVDSRKTEIADHAFNRTPGGKNSPNQNVFTVDEPMVQQGAMSYLQSGDYYVFSYDGGDWYNSTTGSTWRIGPSGRVAFEIDSTNRMLHISAINVTPGYVTLDISTNWIVGTPSIEFCNDLSNPQWLSCPAQTMTNMTTYWRGVCPSSTNSYRFFRAVSPGGESLIRSHYNHEFLDGITIGGQTFTNLVQLKAMLEALP